MRSRPVIVSVLLACCLALVPQVRAAGTASWVGKNIMLKKAGVRISCTDKQGQQKYVALTNVLYTVVAENASWLMVRGEKRDIAHSQKPIPSRRNQAA
jgi:hypothetical protein